jgi:SAM-dependent methyltransferase
MDTQNQDPTSPDRLVTATEAPKMYTELASWWSLLSPPGDYAEEAAFYLKALIEACERSPQTLLELGSGGGNNASHLKSRFQMVLVDLSPGMLAVSRRLNPECEHVEGDMRTVRLGRQFDCVFVHDAIVYMTTEADLRKAIETAFVHCRPGGAALFAPDHIKENFRPSTLVAMTASAKACATLSGLLGDVQGGSVARPRRRPRDYPRHQSAPHTWPYRTGGAGSLPRGATRTGACYEHVSQYHSKTCTV